MKRFLKVGMLFCTAAILGMGITLFLPGNASACICLPEVWQPLYDCDSPLCSEPTPHAVYDCGTCSGSSNPCGCVFKECRTRCVIEP